MQIINPNFLNKISEDYLPEKDISNYEIRPTVRVFVLDKDKNIGLIKNPEAGVLFPPGGGIEKNEEIFEAVQREVAEELGVFCEMVDNLGVLEHYHEKWMKFFVIHHVYAKSDRTEFKIDYEEYDTNFEKVWMNVFDYQKLLTKYIDENPNDIWARGVLYFLNKNTLAE